MRFMMLMIPKGYETAAAGQMPEAKAVAAMMKYNEALQKAGVLLGLDGLHPPSMGARVSFSGGKSKVSPGPQRCPASDNEVIEVRQVQELADFPDDVKKVVAKYPEMQPKKRHP